jgi:glycosyltransferase involved in cell wall biosynthesis
MTKELRDQNNIDLNYFLAKYYESQNLGLRNELQSLYRLWTLRIYFKLIKNPIFLTISKLISKVLNLFYSPISRVFRNKSRIKGVENIREEEDHESVYQKLKIERSQSVYIVIGHEASFTGAPIVLLELIKELNLKHKVLLFLNKPGPLVENYENIAVTKVLKNERLTLPEQNEFKVFLKTLLDSGVNYTILLNTVAQNFWIDFLISNEIEFSTWIHELSTSWNFWPETFKRQIENSRSIIADSEIIRKQLQSRFGLELNVNFIRNGQFFEIKSNPKEVKSFLGMKSQKLIVIAGTRSIRKGFDLLPRFVFELEKKQIFDEGFKVLWLGESMNPELDMFVISDIEKFGVRDKIEIMGTVNNYADFINACDIFVHLAREDSAPQVIDTAQEMGKPIVLFEGISGKSVDESKTGFKVVKYLDLFELINGIREANGLNGSYLEIGSYSTWPVQADRIRNIMDGDTSPALKKINIESTTAYKEKKMAEPTKEIIDLSVIIPNYNHSKFLQERIQSIIEQSISPAEILFLDDGSSDGSVEIARKELSKTTIPKKFYVNEVNSGSVLNQWIKGIKEACSEWIWIAESDDSASLDLVEKANEIIDEFKSDIVIFESKIIDHASQELFQNTHFNRIHVPTILNEAIPGESITFCMRDLKRDGFLIRNLIVNVSAIICRKNYLLEGTERAISKKPKNIVGDWATYLELDDNMKVTYCNLSLNKFRRNDLGVSSKAFSNKELENSRDFILSNYEKLYSEEDILRFKIENLRIKKLYDK